MKAIAKILRISTGFFLATTQLICASVLANNIETPSRDSQDLAPPTETPPAQQILELSLQDAINLALENNRSLKNAYLQRIIDRENLAEDTAIYVPRLTPEIGLIIGRDRILSGESITDTGNLNLSSDLAILVPTGGEFSITWNGGTQLQTVESLGDFSNNDILDQTLTLNFNQPLLRGFGPTITNIPIVEAKLREDRNILTLKSELINIITQTIIDYRNLVRAQESLQIQQQALDRAIEQLEITRAFIEAGRRARVDIIQNETQIANQELTLLGAENELKNARSRLISTLDIERNSLIIATETPKREAISLAEPLNLQELLKLAFINDTDYLNALINVDFERLNLLLAKDNNRWDLDLDIQYQNNLDGGRRDIGNSSVSASLTLTKDFFGPRTSTRNIVRSEVELERTLIDLEEAKEELTIAVEDDIRQVNFALERARRATLARELAERQLQIEQEKQRLGAGDLFQLINFENSLVQAQNQELNAIIEYLDALTNLQQTVGITLDIWQIELEK